jgi:TetR/AcrR family transcriptional regulator, regulator of cefoperazone and chloramphenicol sensitivity
MASKTPAGIRNRRIFDGRAGGAAAPFDASVSDADPVIGGMRSRPKVFQVEYLFRLEYFCQMLLLERQGENSHENQRMTPTKRPRRPSAGGYARGDETRQRIIDAAVKLFGEHGFAGASTRDIAAAAGVNAPALQYYFENKEGLYQACAEYITNDLRDRFAPAMRQANDVLKGNGDMDALVDAFIGIQAVTLDSVLMEPHASKKRLFVARELADEEADIASKLLHRRLKQPLSKVTLALLSRITGAGANDPVTRIRMLTLKGQIMPFYHPPGACLDLLGWKEIDAAKGALLKATVLEQTRTLLNSWRAVSATSQAK